jgi:hypothetical protein
LSDGESIRNHAAFISSVAGLLRGYYKQSAVTQVVGFLDERPSQQPPAADTLVLACLRTPMFGAGDRSEFICERRRPQHLVRIDGVDPVLPNAEVSKPAPHAGFIQCDDRDPAVRIEGLPEHFG